MATRTWIRSGARQDWRQRNRRFGHRAKCLEVGALSRWRRAHVPSSHRALNQRKQRCLVSDTELVHSSFWKHPARVCVKNGNLLTVAFFQDDRILPNIFTDSEKINRRNFSFVRTWCRNASTTHLAFSKRLILVPNSECTLSLRETCLALPASKQNQCQSIPQVTSTTRMSEEITWLVRKTERGTTQSSAPADQAASPPSANLTITKTHRPTQGEKNAPGYIEDEFHALFLLETGTGTATDASSRPVNARLHLDIALTFSPFSGQGQWVQTFRGLAVNCGEVLPDVAFVLVLFGARRGLSKPPPCYSFVHVSLHSGNTPHAVTKALRYAERQTQAGSNHACKGHDAAEVCERSTASRTPTSSAGEIEGGNNCSVMNNMLNVFCVHFGGRWGGRSLAISNSQLRNELRHPKKNVFCT